jgi:Transposase
VPVADRVWAVEGCNGIGRHLAQRLVADGESVVDVPAKLSARGRVFATGQGRKTDPVDAHSVAVAALRTKGLRQVSADDTTVALRLLADRRDLLGRARTETISRLHHLLLELVAGGAKKYLSAPQAGALLNTVRPRDIVGRTRRQLACELTTELAVIDKKIKDADRQPTELIAATGGGLPQLHGIGLRRGPTARRYHRRQPLRRPRTRRILERHRTHRRLLRRPATPPPVPRRKPAYQPRPAHHGRRPAPPRHRGTSLPQP